MTNTDESNQKAEIELKALKQNKNIVELCKQYSRKDDFDVFWMNTV